MTEREWNMWRAVYLRWPRLTTWLLRLRGVRKIR